MSFNFIFYWLFFLFTVFLNGSTSLCMPMLILEKAMATHSSTFAWKIPWVEEHGRSMGSKSQIRLSDFTFTFLHWRRKWQPTPAFLPGESQGRGSLVGCCLWDCTESDTTEATQQQQHSWFTFLFHIVKELYPNLKKRWELTYFSQFS